MSQADNPPSPGETIVVVPCYNEARRLDMAAYEDFLSRRAGISLLLVDDGSRDSTPELLERLRAQHPRQVLTLRLSTNVGKAEAVRRGVQLALRRRPAMVGYWDADLATPLETIPRFESLLRERPELVLVMGSRVALLGRQIRRRYVRHVLGRAFATAASVVLRMPVYDTQCGAKLFRVTPLTTELFGKPFGTRWVFDVELLARLVAAARNGGPRAAEKMIYEYPLEAWRDVAGSRLKARDFASATVDLAAIGWRYRRSWVARPESAKGVAEPAIDHAHRQASGDATQRDAA